MDALAGIDWTGIGTGLVVGVLLVIESLKGYVVGKRREAAAPSAAPPEAAPATALYMDAAQIQQVMNLSDQIGLQTTALTKWMHALKAHAEAVDRNTEASTRVHVGTNGMLDALLGVRRAQDAAVEELRESRNVHKRQADKVASDLEDWNRRQAATTAALTQEVRDVVHGQIILRAALGPSDHPPVDAYDRAAAPAQVNLQPRPWPYRPPAHPWTQGKGP
jgi:hypothetical protein